MFNLLCKEHQLPHAIIKRKYDSYFYVGIFFRKFINWYTYINLWNMQFTVLCLKHGKTQFSFFVHCLLFVLRFIVPRPRIFHWYWHVTIADEGLQILTYVRKSCMANEQKRFLSVPHPLWHGASVYTCHSWHWHLLPSFK